MAYYAALVSIVQLLKGITHPEHQYAKFLLEKQQIITSLYEKFNRLQELLEDYSPNDKEAADFLERRIRDAAYQAQEIIESHTSDRIAQPRCLEKIIHIVPIAFWHLISACQKTKPLKVHEELEQVKEEVDSIVEELMRINNGINESHRAHEEDFQLSSHISADSSGRASKAQAPSGRSTMVGFEEHLAKIQEQLFGQSSRREVISIVGMGGLGKSTLAGNIFNDELTDYYFDCCAWVTVSQNYYLRDILLAIVSSLNINKELHGVGKEVLKQNIYKYLKGRRYLIIMDDMWDIKIWNDIKMILPDDSNGSRLIITTRLLDVADYAGKSAFVHQMQFLNEDQSWNLFCEKVFCPPELEDIGRLIAKNCRGLPLAIVVVAGLLSMENMTRYDWEEIARDVSLAAIKNDDFSKLLSLSYSHLPHHLKPCFLHLGGFPEDCTISISKLIKLWVAEGFLKSIEYKSLEEVAEEYLRDLVNRNLVLITKWRSNGKFRCCSIHDLLRDLCLQRARCENFLHFPRKNDDFHREAGNVHCLYVHPNSSFPEFKGKSYASHVRSIFLFRHTWAHFLSEASNFKFLRVLDALKVKFDLFPIEILELLHLRYLALLRRRFNIPPLIFKLQNLQTLIVVSPSPNFLSTITLPSEIWKMPHLRHVMIDQVALAPILDGSNTRGVRLLERLQTLLEVANFTFTRNAVEMFPSIKKLKVKFWDYKHYENYWEKFGLENLVHLCQLETLDINFNRFSRVAVPLPENFAFPLNLRKLSLWGGMLPWKDLTAVGSLPNLQVLKLRCNAFIGEEWVPIEGQFPKLKFLQLEELHDLKHWRAENTHFPCLERLLISYCNALEEIPSEIGDIPTLQLIELHHRNSALESSALKIQEERLELGNDDLKVYIHHIGVHNPGQKKAQKMIP